MFEKVVVIDGKSHLLGRLASYVAKELLSGQRIVVVRAEKLVISGSLFRNKVKYGEFLNKTMNHNPRRGFVHARAPSRIFWRTVRGMLPHKTPRGAAALGKLKIFEGVPPVYENKQKKCVPDALKQIRLKNEREFCFLGDLSHEVGWGKKNLIDTLEEKRKKRSSARFEAKKTLLVQRAKTNTQDSQFKEIKKQLSAFGY